MSNDSQTPSSAEQDVSQVPFEIQRSLQGIAEHLRPDNKTFREKLVGFVCTPQFLIGTILLGILYPGIFTIHQWYRSSNQSRVANFEQLQSVREDKHRELELTLETLTRGRTELFLIDTVTEMMGGEKSLNQSYLAFGKRTLSDLKIRRASSLMIEIGQLDKEIIETGEQLGYSEAVYGSQSSDFEKINSHLILGLILAQEMNIGYANSHLVKCKELINEAVAVLNSELKDKQAEGDGPENEMLRLEKETIVAERRLLHRIAVHAESTIAVVNSISLLDQDLTPREIAQEIRKQFRTPLSRMKEFPGLRGRLLKGVLLAVRSLVADSLLSANVRGDSSLLRQGRSDSENALDEFHRELRETYEQIGGYTERQFKNYVDETRYFVLVSWGHVELKSIERLIKQSKNPAGRAAVFKRLEYVRNQLHAVDSPDELLVRTDVAMYREAVFGSEYYRVAEAAIVGRLITTSRSSRQFESMTDMLLSRILREVEELEPDDLTRNSIQEHALEQLKQLFLDDNLKFQKLKALKEVLAPSSDSPNDVPKAPRVNWKR